MIILFNGPPGCGKDAACKWLVRKPGLIWTNNGVRHRAFARHLKRTTHADYGYYDRPFDYYEKVKDVPSPDFFGKTPRESYIEKSEVRTKPFFGKDYYGHMLLRTESDVLYNYNCVISDSGFEEEAEPLRKWFGSQYLFQIRIHREGCNFDNDSRSYWNNPAIRSVDVINNGTLEEYFQKIQGIMEGLNVLLPAIEPTS